MSLKIEAGKEYVTRDGRRARIYAVDGGGRYPVHGALFDNEVWLQQTWNAAGRWCDGIDGVADLAGPWVAPKLQRIAWICTDPYSDQYGRVNITPAATLTSPIGWERAPWLDQPEQGGGK